MKNLVVLHLESISRQRLETFASVFPNTLRLMREGVVFDNFFSSATSTGMALAYFFHANDFELDASTRFVDAKPARNNPHLFEVLQACGYHSSLICLNGFPQRPIVSPAWGHSLPPIRETNDFPRLFGEFDALTDTKPFAIYVWDLITHIEHSLALAAMSTGLVDQLRRACSVADDAVGRITHILERKGLLDDTTIVLYGDHGDDFWSHGFKGGMVHGTEPYTDIIATPFAIRDPALAPAVHTGLASTIDIAPTCLALLGVEAAMPFAHSGVDLFAGAPERVYAQNYTANQPDNVDCGIAKAFSVSDDTWTLVASSHGVEFFAHPIDPGNHCNLLHLFTLDGAGQLTLQAQRAAMPHFLAALASNPQAVSRLAGDFRVLRDALLARVDAKRQYIVDRGVEAVHALDRRCLATISRRGRDSFFGVPARPAPQPGAAAFDFSWRLA